MLSVGWKKQYCSLSLGFSRVNLSACITAFWNDFRDWMVFIPLCDANKKGAGAFPDPYISTYFAITQEWVLGSPKYSTW